MKACILFQMHLWEKRTRYKGAGKHKTGAYYKFWLAFCTAGARFVCLFFIFWSRSFLHSQIMWLDMTYGIDSRSIRSGRVSWTVPNSQSVSPNAWETWGLPPYLLVVMSKLLGAYNTAFYAVICYNDIKYTRTFCKIQSFTNTNIRN